MRVIAGSARSIPLETVKGTDTRPTTDRIKETLFNMIAGDVSGARFLDLFAGSGQIAIEALSRGASEAVLVDASKRATDCIRRNLDRTGLSDRARVLTSDAAAAIRSLAGEGFDIVFADPPYALSGQEHLLATLAAQGLVRGDGLVILEAAIDRVFDEDAFAPLTVARDKRYKTNRHLFLRMKA